MPTRKADDRRVIVFDTELRRPACVLLQAAFKADYGLAHRFPSKTWLVAPTPAMRRFSVTEEQLVRLVEIAVTATKQQKVDR